MGHLYFFKNKYTWPVHPSSQPTTDQKYSKKKKENCVCAEYIPTFFSLSLFPKQSSLTPIYLAIILCEVLHNLVIVII
jgi:hypothetical protein